MSFRARFISAVCVIAFVIGLFAVSIYGNSGNPSSTSDSLFSNKETLNLWYADGALTDYLNDIAVSYNESQNRVRIEPRRITANEYFDTIYQASVEGDDFPDIFIMGNDSIGRSWLAGLASQITDTEHFATTAIFPQAAQDAVTYEGKLVGYPLCFETSALLYNTDYLNDMAASAGRTDENAVPGTMVDLISMSNSYDTPEGVNAILKWDVSDIFFNYAFIGNYVDVGGPAGDDPEQLNIYNQDAISCMSVYHQLNDYFAIDTQTDDYASDIQDFADGRIIFTIATSDSVRTLRDKVEAGESSVNYGVARIPDSTAQLLTRTMSVTQALLVNGYSLHQDEANAFIQYLLFSGMDHFYDRTGKAPAMAGYEYSDPHMEGFFEAYQDSVPITKLREASNFWMMLENAFSKVWSGENPNQTLLDLTRQLMIQITGNEDYEVKVIENPAPIELASELENVQ